MSSWEARASQIGWKANSDGLRAGEGEHLDATRSRATASGGSVCDHGNGQGGSKPVSRGSGSGDVTHGSSIEEYLGDMSSSRGEKCLIDPRGA